MAGDRANPQRKGQAAAGAVVRAGGAGVAVASLVVTSKDATVKPW